LIKCSAGRAAFIAAKPSVLIESQPALFMVIVMGMQLGKASTIWAVAAGLGCE
jgi:hypothetical protein